MHERCTTLTKSQVFDISAYLPDALIPAYNNFRETVVTALWILGIGNGVAHDVSAGNSHISFNRMLDLEGDRS